MGWFNHQLVNVCYRLPIPGGSGHDPLIQWSFLVPLIGGRYHIIPHLAVYATYIPLLYCLLGNYISPTTYSGNQKQLLIDSLNLDFSKWVARRNLRKSHLLNPFLRAGEPCVVLIFLGMDLL